MASRRLSCRRYGFTLVELLVVVGIIAVLVSILLPALNKARIQARTVQCLANMRQMSNILYMYANDNRGGMVWAYWSRDGLPHLPFPEYSTDDGTATGRPFLNASFSDRILLGHYTHPNDIHCTNGEVPTNSIWHCPEDMKDLVSNPAKGYSYCSYGLNLDVYPQVAIPLAATPTVPNLVQVWKITSVRSPSLMLSFIDSNQTRFTPRTSYYVTNNPSSGNFSFNVPGSYYNHASRHGLRGTNVSFIDGHAETLQNSLDASGNLYLQPALKARLFLVKPTDQ